MSVAAISRRTGTRRNTFTQPDIRSSRPMIHRKGGAGVTSMKRCSICRTNRHRIRGRSLDFTRAGLAAPLAWQDWRGSQAGTEGVNSCGCRSLAGLIRSRRSHEVAEAAGPRHCLCDEARVFAPCRPSRSTSAWSCCADRSRISWEIRPGRFGTPRQPAPAGSPRCSEGASDRASCPRGWPSSARGCSA